MIIWLVLLWAVLIFGFQIALRLLEKPVPEQASVEFNTVWPSITDGSATQEEYIVFAGSVLQVLGKRQSWSCASIS